ncbi:hypothetical protein A6A05_01385 [Magnetospirillum moscoviense]|uniref:PcRGLX/YetA-like N-terminal RIFT barrel domain-containing protein n=1 Tax=Magnetospirillum moscoviense TaxID=1437059 RepID=A0A178MTJ3_9PROT|nr:hypothetical protein A6A05_01385 [Magnetospirillum moscoviense]
MLACPADAVTCVRVTGQVGAGGALPVTFGQPFRPGDVPGGATLIGRDDRGAPVTLQLDARATHPDGSLRFAVISADLAHSPTTLAILPGQAPAIAVPAKPDFDLGVEITVFSRQVSVVKFGDRKGTTPGVPFRVGQTITLAIGDERFSLVVGPTMSGGDMAPFMRIAQAFVAVINGQSTRYGARWNGANDGYEKLWVTTIRRGETFVVSADHDGPGRVSVLPYLAVEPPATWVAALPPKTAGAVWLAGPVADEQAIVVPFTSPVTGQVHPQLSARLHVRRYGQSKAVRADVILENGWATEPDPRNFTYDIAIRRNGVVAYHHEDVSHTHRARWHKVVWSDGFSEPEIAQHIPYLLQSGAVPHFDPTLVIPAAVVQRDVASFAKRDTGPLGTAQVMTYMPTAGGRPDIGLLPRWAVVALLTMDSGARAILFANADAGAGVPLHYRDKRTDLPISLDDHPTMVMGPGRARPRDAFPAVTIGDSPWTAQIAHHPSLSYLPYLLSGDLFYLEEVAFWANWVLASVDPVYRGGSAGLIFANEVRGQAWSLRTLGEAALILPDSHPMKGYFNSRLAANVAWYIKRYAGNADPAQGSVLGIIAKPDDPGVMAPWQQDFLFMAFGQLAQQGVPGAEEVLRWLGRFSVGRWAADADGFCHQMAPAYYIKIRERGGPILPTWRALFELNWPDVKVCPPAFPFGEPDSAGGYVANANAVLAIAADFDIAGAAMAYRRLQVEAPGMVRAFPTNPTFAIVPRGIRR